MNDELNILKKMIAEIQAETRSLSIMEVCGTHTMAIAKSGIRELMPPNIRLISGPGCPVCVTAQGDIDSVIELAKKENIILATFGDMIKVPGTYSSLQQVRSEGANIQVVYSPTDALSLAKNHPAQEIVFLGIGFETTAPIVGASIKMAKESKLANFSVLSWHKLVPPALEVIFSDPGLQVDALLCPGNVSVVIGLKPYEELAAKYQKPFVVTGFDNDDILQGILMILLQLQKNQAIAENQYSQLVRPEGNLVAKNILEQVFKPVNARWRGLGEISQSGLEIADEYEEFNARKKFGVVEMEDKPIKGCACGQILTGKISPHDCPLFATKCTPAQPVGPCMVSTEGACAAYYRYSAWRGRKNYDNR